MARCSDCRHAGRVESTDYREVLGKCHRARGGACEACEKLLKLENKIDGARCALYRLLKERDEMTATLNEHHDTFVHHLPVELSSQILSHCLPYGPSLDVFSVDNFSEEQHIRAVINIGHVCRNWRDIAYRAPELWTIFSATITSDRCVKTIGVAQEWLVRSVGLSLCVNILVDSTVDEESLEVAREVVALALLRAPRWKVLNLQVPSRWMRWISKDLSSIELDELQHIHFGATDDFDEADVLYLHASPTQITMYQAWLHQISINWSQLTHFLVPSCPVTIDECIQLFRDAPCLTLCSIKEVRKNSASATPVVNASMRSLLIHSTPSGFWRHFSFPSLQVLDISHPHHASSEDWTHIRDFLHRSGCELKELSITDYECIHAGVVSIILKLTTSLERLVLNGKTHSGSFFCAMNTVAVMEPDFMGRLRALTCATEDYLYDWSSLAMFLNTMVYRRTRSLQSFDFQYRGGNYQDITSFVNCNPEMFKLAIHAMVDLDSKIIHDDETDVLEMLRSTYNYKNSH